MRAASVASDEGRHVGASRKSVAAFLDEWVEAQRPNLRATTHASYVIAVGRINAAIGARPLQSLTPFDVESLYRALTCWRRTQRRSVVRQDRSKRSCRASSSARRCRAVGFVVTKPRSCCEAAGVVASGAANVDIRPTWRVPFVHVERSARCHVDAVGDDGYAAR